MNRFEVPHLDVCPESCFEKAIDQWLTARCEYQKKVSEENQRIYNATYFALGDAWVERHAETANVLGGFEVFRRGLIAAETDG
ncbi:MAG TPA: hypothetical protein VG844_10885 [Terracidiphilus sp.]|nr:hypothetical protein [Terracidiphilus sp.]